MKTTIADDVGIMRKTFSVTPMGREVSKEEFTDVIESYPHRTRTNYWNADVYKVMWMGKEKQIAMYYKDTYSYYVM